MVGWLGSARTRGVAGVLAVAALLVVGCSGSDSGSGADGGGSSGTTEPAVATEPLSPPGQTYAVGRRNLDLVDASRPTDANPNAGLEALDERRLPTIVLYPAEGAAGAPAKVDAEIADGSFPLVVFSHGLNGSGEIYAAFVEPLVRQGYVVALPTFPLTTGRVPVQGDFVNQPADVSFLIDEVFALSEEEGGWLAGHVDRELVAAAGHSMGAVTAFGIGFNDCCLDDRIDAVLSVSGVAASFPDGEYAWSDTPLLLVHGARDQIVPVGGSDGAYDIATGPTWYLRFPDVDHYGVGFGPAGTVTMQASTAFFDAHLKDTPAALDAMPSAVAASPGAEWRVKP